MQKRRGFTVIELLTVVSITIVLMAITVPCYRSARQQGRRLINIRNQKEIVRALTLFAFDHDDSFPASVAPCATATGYRWQDPRKVKATTPLPHMRHSSVAGYLADYIDKPDTLSCPNPPTRHIYWREAWQVADEWNHPLTSDDEDALFGTYCLYWNYTGYLRGYTRPFKGPSVLYGGPQQSDLLVSDYFGYNEWRNLGRFGSCEVLPASGDAVATEGALHSSYWSYESRDEGRDRHALGGKLYAGYVDGHVETYTPTQTVPMEASESPDGTIPYAPYRIDKRNPGEFYIPANAVKNKKLEVRRVRR